MTSRSTVSRVRSAAAMPLGLAAVCSIAPPTRADVAFAPAVLHPVGDGPISVTVADVDGDGAPDVITANTNPGELSLLVNNGDGTLAPEVRLGAGGGTPRRVEVGDVDGDGDADLVAAIRGGPGSIAVLRAEGAGVFAPAVQHGPGSFSFALSMTDLDGDGDLDVAVVEISVSGVGVSVFRNAGDGTFPPPDLYAAIQASIVYAADLAAADVDGDGHPDLVVVSDCPVGCDASVVIMINAGDGTFGPPVPVDLGVASAGSVRARDLDGDQDADLAIVDCVFPGSDLVIAANDGAGAFSVVSRSSTSRNCTVGSVTTPDGIALLDVDTDGAADAVLPSMLDDEVRVLRNKGDLTFEAARAFAVGERPIAVATGDLDGDGRADIVSADKAIEGAPTVAVLINDTPPAGPPADLDGDGTVGFADLLILLAAWGPCSIAPGACPADLDGDGIVGFADLLALLAAWSG